MKKKTRMIFVPAMALSLFACSDNKVDSSSSRPNPVEDEKVHIFVLAGQSGARGKARNADLSEEDKLDNEEVGIIQDGLMMPNLNNIPETVTGSLGPVKPGYGDTSTEFGPEIGMAKAMASRFKKNGAKYKSVIVKYTACGSTFTSDWYSSSLVNDDSLSDKLNMTQIREDKNKNATGPLTSNLYQLVDLSLDLIKAEGLEPVIDGVVFCHGEQDAKFSDNMEIYEKALGYFIDDFRSYFSSPSLPFVITEAGTNAARYSNKLREIQNRVGTTKSNCSFISTKDLYTNTFEPWHFGAESNIILGERMAEGIIHLNDNRKIESFNLEESYQIPLNGKDCLPTYIEANFSNGSKGIVPVKYIGEIDDKTSGSKNVKFIAETNWGKFEGNMNVVVNENPYVDGNLSDWNGKLNKINDKVSVGFKSSEDGLYVRAEVKDNEIWTDGEAWESGDMGQKGINDDLRLYLTTTTTEDRIPVFLSADNLLRIYEPGTKTYTPNVNYVYKKLVEGAKYHVRTTGEVNVPNGSSDCNGMSMELYLPYEELGINDIDELKIALSYSDISKSSEEARKEELVSFFGSEKDETSEESYFPISDLL